MGWYAQTSSFFLLWPHSRTLLALGCQIFYSKASPPCVSHSSFFLSVSTPKVPWSCSCDNCFLHLRIQNKIPTLSTTKPRMPLPSMEPTPCLTYNSVFKELFSGQRYLSLFPCPQGEGKCLAFSRAEFCFFGPLCVQVSVIYLLGSCCLVKKLVLDAHKRKKKFFKISKLFRQWHWLQTLGLCVV